VPLFCVSDTIVNVQISSELAPNLPHSLFVSSNGAPSSPEAIIISSLCGIVTYRPDPNGDECKSGATRCAIAQHPDYSLVNASSKAKPGEIVTVYPCGIGQTDPTVASGAPTPLQPVPASVEPIVTLDNQQVDILYASLTPTGPGFYQINFKAPDTSGLGNLQLIVKQGDVTPVSGTP
jgi:uncharacterized protein (TIGR03437 family)